MTTTHEPTRHRDRPAWRYGMALLGAGLLAGVAMVQTFGNVSAATLDEEAPAVTPYDPQAAQPLPEVVAPVPFL